MSTVQSTSICLPICLFIHYLSIDLSIYLSIDAYRSIHPSRSIYSDLSTHQSVYIPSPRICKRLAWRLPHPTGAAAQAMWPNARQRNGRPQQLATGSLAAHWLQSSSASSLDFWIKGSRTQTHPWPAGKLPVKFAQICANMNICFCTPLVFPCCVLHDVEWIDFAYTASPIIRVGPWTAKSVVWDGFGPTFYRWLGGQWWRYDGKKQQLTWAMAKTW